MRGGTNHHNCGHVGFGRVGTCFRKAKVQNSVIPCLLLFKMKSALFFKNGSSLEFLVREDVGA